MSAGLFQSGLFRLHSGATSDFKIECDALTESDWEQLASIVARRVRFGLVVGVPRGGLAFAEALEPYCTQGPTLVVDDVLTTGASMDDHHADRDDIGIVVFARGPCPPWVTPLLVASDFLTNPPEPA